MAGKSFALKWQRTPSFQIHLRFPPGLTFISCSVSGAWQGQEYQLHLSTSGFSSHRRWRCLAADLRVKHRTEGFVPVTLVVWFIRLIVSPRSIQRRSVFHCAESCLQCYVTAQGFSSVAGSHGFPVFYMTCLSFVASGMEKDEARPRKAGSNQGMDVAIWTVYPLHRPPLRKCCLLSLEQIHATALLHGFHEAPAVLA